MADHLMEIQALVYYFVQNYEKNFDYLEMPPRCFQIDLLLKYFLR